ncbi:winged helix-turn-helix domain-containing protein [Longimicrobium sp.]|uniref:winged helix-turn-helix domain-containing protein n=1 Tax=Longimicrobium sp. TaxID=2029185 RepID=UPI002BCE2018|nr:crosslink repair DNA glycosylase YcaQ family protein [Longimicrobium sp.]HSU15939.1 crosslink repair DNA glycosylase YcaQ family protein [Longimicrobium sp.]
MPISLTPDAARALMLAAMGLDRRPRRRATKADVLACIRGMGALQIDTISVVNRSPYFVLWSRLGAYEPRWLDELLAGGALFEYWAHEACFLPIEDYPLFRNRMLDRGWMKWRFSHAVMEKHPDQVARVLETIREHGPVRSAELGAPKSGSGSWWGWKPEKRILESLFTAGELMIARREGFQRVYDLRERVLPGWSDAALPSREDGHRALALKAVRAMGIAKAKWVADWYRMAKKDTPRIVRELAAEGALLEVAVDGWKEPGYVHPGHRALAESAAAGKIRPVLTTLLSPFDPLVWDRARGSELFGFDYRLECYTPAPKRVYGYFTLPILRRGALIGRVDAKAHRSEGVFELKTVHLEPGVRITQGLVDDVARAVRECAAWHRTPCLAVRRSNPPELAAKLSAAMEME